MILRRRGWLVAAVLLASAVAPTACSHTRSSEGTVPAGAGCALIDVPHRLLQNGGHTFAEALAEDPPGEDALAAGAALAFAGGIEDGPDAAALRHLAAVYVADQEGRVAPAASPQALASAKQLDRSLEAGRCPRPP